ncbi:MAG: tetratricopeptide repeat protein [Bryobacterales bacterium]
MFAALLGLLLLAAPAPQDALREAAAALERNDYAAAAPLLEKAVAEDPENTDLRFNLAFAYTQLEQDGRAVDEYQKVLAAKPDLEQARQNLIMVLLRNDRFAEAAPELEKLVAARPGDRQTQLYLAEAWFRSEQPAKAIPAFRKAQELGEDTAMLHLELGQSLAATGAVDEAVVEYRRAGELDPELATLELQLAEQIEQSGDTGKALTLYKGYLERHPGDPAVLERVAMIELEQGDALAAIAPLEAVTAESPTAANWAALAHAYQTAGQNEKAFGALGKALQAAPEDVDLRLRYATALLKAEQFEQAGGHYLQSTKLDPTRAEGWNGLAFCFYKLENYPAALNALQEAAKRAEPLAGNLFLRAVVEDQLQLFEQAKASYEAFLALKPDLTDEVWKAEQRLKTIEKILAKK